MKNYLRFCAWCVLLMMALMAPFPLFLFCAFIYVFFWNGYELFIITTLIDMTFGVAPTAFLYTLSLGVLLILGTLLRPYLSWYTTET